jgi:hypothetical protein
VARELDYSYEALQGAVDRLLAMHDEVTTLRSQLSARISDAAPGAWPDIPSVQSFAGRYHAALTGVEARITHIEQSLESARVALVESIRAMRNVDAAQQEELNRIAAQIDVVDHVPPAPRSVRVPGSIS